MVQLTKYIEKLNIKYMYIFLIFVFLTLAIWKLPVSLSTDCLGPVSQSEYEALHDFYESTDGLHWDWDTTLPASTIWVFPSLLTDPCSNDWQGLTCTAANLSIPNGTCAVLIISLTNYRLHGTLPPSLSNFSLLASLYIGENELTGTIPSDISKLDYLTEFAVYQNSLTGTIPNSIGEMSWMKFIYVYDNSLSGVIPSGVASMSNLIFLCVQENMISGTISERYSQLPYLYELVLAANVMTGTIPCNWENATSLSIFQLTINYLTGTIPTELAYARLLTNIYLDSNSLTGVIPSEFGLLSLLEFLYLDTNSFSGTIPSELCRLHVLQEFSCFQNRLTGIIPTEIGQLSLMGYLSFYSNMLTGPIPSSAGQFIILFELDTSTNYLSNTIPNELGQLVNSYFMFLVENFLSGTIPTTFVQFTRITNLDVNINLLSGTIPAVLGQLTTLVGLNLALNALSGTIPDVLGELTALTFLFLNDCNLTGSIPSELGNLRLINYLTLYSNCLTATIPSEIGRLIELETFLVEFNHLTGTIPSELYYLRQTTELYLSFNQMSGTITNFLAEYENLKYLYLDGNYFSGSIPSEFSMQTSLIELSVTENYLLGSIHPFTNRSKLEILNVSSNLLTGKTPNLPYALQFLDASDNQLTESIGTVLYNCTQLEYLDVGGNEITGTIPEYFQTFNKLRYFNASANRLVGSIESIPVGGVLESLDISQNELSGTLPVSLLQQPLLHSALLFSNCFSGSIPAGMCSNSNLNNFIADSLAANCGNSIPTWLQPLLHGVYPKRSMVGSLPSCIWQLPNLQILRLSGNQLTGLLHDIGYNSSLHIVDLSSNNLIGSIPISLQLFGGLEQLDLSQNQLSGTLVNGFTMPDDATVFDLTVNRLSGNIPDSLYNCEEINILAGNLFQCQEDNLPANDPASSNYVCGAKQFDASLLAAAAGFVPALIAMCIMCPRWYAVAFEVDCLLPKVRRAIALISVATAIIVAVALVLYVVMKEAPELQSQFSTHTSQYTWTTTAAFLHGWAPVFVIFTVLLMCSCVLFRDVCFGTTLEIHKKQAPQNEFSGYGVSNAENKSLCSDGRAMLWIVLVHGCNMVSVVAVNALYVVTIVSGVSQSKLLILQYVLGCYKLVWNSLVIPWLTTNLLEDDSLSHRLFMALFAFVGGPFISTFFSSTTCFYYLLTGQQAIQSTFEVKTYFCSRICTIQCYGTACTSLCIFECAFESYDKTQIYTSNVPTWLYSYQCSSSILVDYVPVLVYSSIMSGVVVPCLYLAYLYIPSSFLVRIVPSWLQSQIMDGTAAAFTTEQAMKIKSKGADKQDKIKPLLNGQSIQVKLMLNMTILLTFGLASPLLALVLLLEVVGVYLQWHYMVGRYLELLGPDGRSHALERIRSSEQDISGGLREYLVVMIYVGIFWSLFVFDMIGDVYGNLAGGLCTLLPFSIPIAVWLVKKVKQMFLENAVKGISTDCVEVEMASASSPIQVPQERDTFVQL